MEDFQEQEYEFLRRLDEERVDRRKLLKRGLATAAGLTVIALPEAALAARAKALAEPPIRGTKKNLAQLVANAKKEGHLNVIALPPDWANYGEIISTFSKKYGIGITSDNPQGTSAQENQAIVSLKGDPRAPDVVDVNATFAVAGTVAGLYARYYVSNYATVPRAMKDTRGLWTGDYYGSVTIGYNANLVKTPPKSFADLLKPIYKSQVALNGSPLAPARRSPACSPPRSPTAARSRTSARGSTGSRRLGKPVTTSRWRRPRRRSRLGRRRSRSTGTTTTSRT